jgi:hypothetical protein
MFELFAKILKNHAYKHSLAQIFNYQNYPVTIYTYLATQQTLVKHLATQQTLGTFISEMIFPQMLKH